MNTNEGIDLNELIKLEQMPKVFEQLEVIGKWIDDGLANLNLDNLIVDEEHKQEIKKTRASINKISKELDDRRKFIKQKILEPYTAFEEKYEQEIKNKLSSATEKLTSSINEIEQNQIKEKEAEIKSFAEEYLEYYHIDGVVKYEQIPITINLSNSLTKLKEEVIRFCEKINFDMQAISSDENRNDVLLEYQKNGFNYTEAVVKVRQDIKAKKELEEKLKVKDESEKEIKEIEKIVDEFVPLEIVDEEKMEVTFTVKGTKPQLIELKEFLKQKGIEYR